MTSIYAVVIVTEERNRTGLKIHDLPKQSARQHFVLQDRPKDHRHCRLEADHEINVTTASDGFGERSTGNSFASGALLSLFLSRKKNEQHRGLFIEQKLSQCNSSDFLLSSLRRLSMFSLLGPFHSEILSKPLRLSSLEQIHQSRSIREKRTSSVDNDDSK